MVSTRPLIFKSSSPFTIALVTIPSALIVVVVIIIPHLKKKNLDKQKFIVSHFDENFIMMSKKSLS